jgi:tRNA dimethylallyltransferase
MAPKYITQLPIIAIVGSTASGKTGLAIKLAQRYGGEIICADSRTIYKDMNIGTAKPTAAEQALVPHWGLDLVAPGERFTAVDFKRYAEQKIDEIRARGHVPFLVGGTGLYVDAVLFNYQFGGDVDTEHRAALENMTLEQLHEYCCINNVILPENHLNKRYVIRAIERAGQTTSRSERPISTSIIVGIATERDVLRSRITERIEQLFDDGVVAEATMLGKKYGWDSAAMTGNIYPLIHDHLEQKLSYQELVEKSATIDWRLAKRQMTWLRRNPFIQWFSLADAEQYLSERLASE